MVTPNRTPLILFETETRLRLSGRQAAVGGTEDIARHANKRLRAGHPDPHQVALDAYNGSPDAHELLLRNLGDHPHKGVMAMVPKLHRFATASMGLDAAAREQERADQIPQSVKNSRKMKKAASRRASDAYSEHANARRALLTPDPVRPVETQNQLMRGAGHHLRRSYFPEGPEGDRHHIRALAEIHHATLRPQEDGSLHIQGYERDHVQSLHDALRAHGYDKTHDLTAGYWRGGWDDIHGGPAVLPSLIMRPTEGRSQGARR